MNKPSYRKCVGCYGTGKVPIAVAPGQYIGDRFVFSHLSRDEDCLLCWGTGDSSTPERVHRADT